MKVLMINIVCGIRSTGRICTDIAEVIEKQGHEVRIAYGREEVPELYQKYAVRIGTDLDVRMHAMKARAFDACGFGSKKATERFIRWVREYDPDVIHLHNIHGYYINIEVLFNYLRTCGKRIIWTLHDRWSFTGHTAYCGAFNCEKWRIGCNKCPGLKEYPKSFLDRSARNWRTKQKLFTGIPNLEIITPSEWLAGLVKESFLGEYPVSVIHNGINISSFHPVKSDFRKKYDLESKFIILGVASTWNDMKGLGDFLKLSDSLDERFEVVLVGLSTKQIAGMPDGILGLPLTSGVNELVDIYCGCDVFLNLTYTDTYPTVNLEAAACGARIVTYDTDGSPESAGCAENSITVPKGDLKAVKQLMISLLGEKNSGASVTEINHSNIKDYRNTVEEYALKYARK